MAFSPTPSLAAAAITDLFNGFYHDLHVLSERAGTLLAENAGDRAVISTADLNGLLDLSTRFLEKQLLPFGAGLIFSATSLADAPEGLLEWWVRDNNGTIVKHAFDLSPLGSRFYDYQQLPWFALTVKTGGQSVAGPYLDYPGTDEYILTMTVPLLARGSLFGVAGSDIRVADLEAALIPILRSIPADAALLNGQDRVVAGNSGRFIAGDRIRSLTAEMTIVPIDVPNINFRLLISEEV